MQVALDARAIRNILTLRYDPEKPSWDYQRRLKPADFMQPKIRFDSSCFEELLKDAIRERIAEQKPKHIVIPCGSGIDSTLILALTKEVYDGRITAISVGFNDGKDETRDALKICDSLGVHCRCLIVDNPLQDLKTLIGITKEPRFNLYWYYVVQFAKLLDADLMMTGDGGDEVFAGYTFRYARFLENQTVQGYLSGHSRDWVPDQEAMFSIPFIWNDIYRLMRGYFENDLSPLEQVLLADFNGKLLYDFVPNNRAFYDHFEMANYAPFLDRRVLQYALRLPIGEKYDIQTNAGKLPLRALLESRGLMRKVSREKKGFGMDTVNLWRRHCKELFSYDAVVSRGIINRAWIERAISKADIDPRYANKMLMIHALELYFA